MIAKAKMENLVAKQFEESRIQQITRKVASEKASQLLEKQIQPEVDAFKAEINKQQHQFEELLKKESNAVKTSVEELKQKNVQVDRIFAKLKKALTGMAKAQTAIGNLTSFQTVLTRAQNDDRYAYDQILEWASGA